jgi:hypothetical protein
VLNKLLEAHKAQPLEMTPRIKYSYYREATVSEATCSSYVENKKLPLLPCKNEAGEWTPRAIIQD